MCSGRDAAQQANSQRESWVTARRTAMIVQNVINVERRGGQVAVEGSGAPCVVDWHEAEPSLQFERTA